MRESLLTRDPEFKTVDMALLVGVASAIENESLRRYATLAATMQRRGETATAAAFQAMRDEELKHADDVKRWAAELGQPVAERATFDWQLPPDLSSSWDEIAGSALLTPYRAFAIAVDNEKRAFTLYSYLAARATDARVRVEAERLAVSELQHAAVMRRWRREAWHKERRASSQTGSPPQPQAIQSSQALQALLAQHEQAIARTHRVLAARLRELGDATSAQLLDSLHAAHAPEGVDATAADPQLPASDDPVHLLVAAQRPLEALSEELDTVLHASEGELFERAEAAQADVVARLAKLALRTTRLIDAS